jgi:ribonuclease VapC
MAASPFVLDTSALFTLIEDEDGADRVEEVLRQHEIIIPWVAILEVMYISRREYGDEVANRRYAMLKKLNARIIWEADEPTLLVAARLKATGRLSLADSIIAATAIQHRATLLHKDPEYDTLAGKLSLEPLPYKPLTP